MGFAVPCTVLECPSRLRGYLLGKPVRQNCERRVLAHDAAIRKSCDLQYQLIIIIVIIVIVIIIITILIIIILI